MGMYTELVLSCRIKDDPAVVSVLKYMAGITDVEPPLPDNPLFLADRWTCLFLVQFLPSFTFSSDGGNWGGGEEGKAGGSYWEGNR